MNVNEDNINDILHRYTLYTNQLSNKYNYPNNIRHLLYLIIPAFIIKYGSNNEKTILKCFEETKITISPEEDKVFVAYFGRALKEKHDNGTTTYYTEKQVILNEYRSASMTGLIDSLVHELNHAVNSINNEIKYDDKTVSIRTGLCYLNYKKDNIREFLGKDPEITLEEIINTNQTADIINIINSFSKYHIANEEFNNALYSLKHEISTDTYKSDSYYLQTYITKELMQNKTFFPTIENLRFKGYVADIPAWFDNVIGEDGIYKKFITLLSEIYDKEHKYAKSKFFKNHKLSIIRARISEVNAIIQDFNSKSIFK